MKRVLLPDGPGGVKNCPITSCCWLAEVIQMRVHKHLRWKELNGIRLRKKDVAPVYDAGIRFGRRSGAGPGRVQRSGCNELKSAAAFINGDIWTSCEIFPWLLSTGDNIKIPRSMPPHIRHFDQFAVFFFFFFLNQDVCGASKHVFHALISAPGRLGSRIRCSTFVWQFYLKDTVFFLSRCHLPSEVSPIRAWGTGALTGNVFEGTPTPHGWTALGEPDKVGV